jgi:hypothetical protein
MINNIFRLIEETEQLQQEGMIRDFGRRVSTTTRPAVVSLGNYIKNEYIHPARETVNVVKDTLDAVKQAPTKPRRWLNTMNASYVRQPNLPRVMNDTLQSVQNGTVHLPNIALKAFT